MSNGYLGLMMRIAMSDTVIKSTVVDGTTIEIRYNDDSDHKYELWIGSSCEYSSTHYSAVLHEYNMEVW